MPKSVPVTLTKILTPRPSTAVARPRLEDHAQALCDFALTTLTGGAGFGKTTILRVWAESCRADAAWVTLDEADCDVRSFAAYLDAAFRQAIPEFGRSVLDLLSEGRVEAEAFARAFANELLTASEERERDIVLFLDDFHTVQMHQGVRETVAGLLRTLPPRAHIAIASRFPLEFSPIVKLRAAGRTNDFTQNDLRFTQSEAAELLASDLSERTPLERDVLEALVRRADGWAMALRLSLQAAPGLRGAAPADGDSEHSLFAYLADEVLRAQPSEIRSLLLACAVPKTLDVRTLEQVVRVDDGAGALDLLLSRNLYLESMGTRSYRFHYLFREFLLKTLRSEDPERLRVLKVRYARLLEESGDLTGAVTQYMEAGDFASAADHVGDALIALKYGDNVDRIATILSNLPDALKRERPFLFQLEATVRRRRRDFLGAADAYERAARYALELQDFATACACTIERGSLAGDLRAGGHGRFEESIDLFAKALRYAERCGAKRDMYLKSASVAMGLALAAQFDYEAARPYLATAENLQRAAATQRSDVMITIATIDGWQGEWHRVLEHAELAEDLLRSSEGADYLIGRALKTQAKAHVFLCIDPARALALAEAAVEWERSYNEFDDLPDAYVVLARASLAQAVPAVDRAHEALDEATRLIQRWPNNTTRFEVHACRFEIYILTNRLSDARRELAAARTFAQTNGDAHEQALVVFYEGLFASVSGELSEAAERYGEAFAKFEPLHDRYFAQLAQIAACGVRARLGTLEPQQLREMLERLERSGSPLALRSAPRSASLALAWALRHGVEPDAATALLGDAARQAGDDELVALALDENATNEARVRAIAAIAREGRLERRPTLVRLGRNKRSAVAAAAATALEVFPRADAATLSIYLVGPLRVVVGDETIDERDARWSRRKAVEMLRALALADGPLPKTMLLSNLWPESSAAAAETSLRVTLHALRRALEPSVEGSGHYVVYDGTTLALRKELVSFVDALEAQAAFRRAVFARARDATREAGALLDRTIDLLAAVPAEDVVPAWLAPHVRTWRNTLAASLRASAQLKLKNGTVPAARALVERALLVDPLDEDTVTLALDVALAAGDLERAKSVFLNYKTRLASELSTTPGPAVLERYGNVLKARAENRTTELTGRELEILTLIGRGRSNKQIAGELNLSTWTINGHVARILRKMRVDSRAAAVAAAGGLLDT